MAKCERCGKSVTWALVRYKCPDINGNNHDICKECLDECTKAGKAAKYDLERKTIVFVDKDDIEIRKRCNTCGHVFCYNPVDLQKNKQEAKKAMSAGLTAVMTAGSHATSSTAATSLNRADNAMNRIVDYDRCPACGSRSLTEISKEEFQKAVTSNNTNNTNQATSSADELKKFKELLDSGIITQEEFDAKKKQLLGL